MRKFRLLCPSCNGDYGDIFSIELIENNQVKITYICTDCGYMNSEIKYLYNEG
jgi:C4-type Zn-finger protein